MNLSKFNLPLFLKIEYDCFKRIADIIAGNTAGGNKCLVITDSMIKKMYARELVSSMNEKGFDTSLYLIQDNSVAEAIQISNLVINEDYESIIGIGGGKVLDVSKYAAFMCKKLFISIPTAIAHDGLASPIAVLKCDNGKTKSLGSKIPSGVIIDLNIIQHSPRQLIKAGIGDILSNITAIYDWELAHKRMGEEISDFALLLSRTAVNSILNFNNKDLSNIDFLTQLSESIILSGLAMEMAGTSRPCSGSEHLFSHSMDQHISAGNLHGIQVALGSILSAYLQGQDYQEMIDFLKTFDIPTNLQDIGVNVNDFITVVSNARSTRKGRYTIFDEVDLSPGNLESIYKEIF
jgi:glycerol-1-phosphate dehydrogenase [NAD(P)+]